jgi:hypothetical protein
MFTSLQHHWVLCFDPGDCIILEFCKGEKENRFFEANLLEMHEWEAPESNNTVALIELTGNIPNTISGAFCTS